MALIGKMYNIERDNKKATDEARLLAQQQFTVPKLAAPHGWMDGWMEKTVPDIARQSALGTAQACLQKCWSRLRCDTERGDLPIDNDVCENAIRPFVVGRNWLFSDTPAGWRQCGDLFAVGDRPGRS